MNVYEKLKQLNINIPAPPPKLGIYSSVTFFGDKLLYLSGCGPDVNSISPYLGKVGAELTIEEGCESSKLCAINMISKLDEALGDLNKIKKFVKLTCFVASDTEFFNQPKIADGASSFLIDVFGEEVALASRSAVGVSVLPGNIPVEIEALIELK
ncbi:Enamine deaminase RidA, house cleaning of reactive enamine intermediates, YjgF/YER057c/UK114 family [Anaerosphaera aminiphila DSM 21120]|uniref:Enamine deaminase RidA, house cleaning of reactive enamine intermediates, YjgF/YER057c/UK114 family n=1 Tax=Anaerosphaera aminiphila DSM 21120 TaxID=1120995 RepID=A0A1M5TUJ6_9FIRM|nr:RidA family protein [Anaerosphaera aminiphila]SHH54452.1 Enamine deaminase RidA, house cleaning of reactive enamine intermediates, YjgF/YER057c/UK114 family [Anaerosphaera aminiphila DSM 21120]